MADIMTKEQRRMCMQHVPSSDTKPEVSVRQFLFSCGIRFRKNVRALPGTPDIVMRKYNTVIFINGCFWHGHHGCHYYTHPKTNPVFWEEKVQRNRERDENVSLQLESMGWNVVTIWECELKKDKFYSTMDDLLAQLENNRTNRQNYLQMRKNNRELYLAERLRKKALREQIKKELNEKFENISIVDEENIVEVEDN